MRRPLFVCLIALVALYSGCQSSDDPAVGKFAPDFQGEDMAGQHRKLSDFRGKVVVLTFWATWCGPCVAMLPHERELVQRLQGQPFAMVSVNCDDPGPALQSFLAKNNITWTNFKNGKSGPITDLYGIRGIPTIYVLDAEGVIRYRVPPGGDLDGPVNALMKKM